MISIFISFFLFLFTIFFFGLLLNKIETTTKRYTISNFGWSLFCFSNAIGVAFHELSHAFFCIIFFHKITKISLFRPIKGKQDHILGIVEHQYKKTLYQKTGNFFIGIAPFLTSYTYLFFFIYFYHREFLFNNFELNNLSDFLMVCFSFIKEVLTSHKTITEWVLLFLFLIIATNINLSKEDIKGSLSGIISFFVFYILIICFILFFSIPIKTIVHIILTLNLYFLIGMTFICIITCFVLVFHVIIFHIKKET